VNGAGHFALESACGGATKLATIITAPCGHMRKRLRHAPTVWGCDVHPWIVGSNGGACVHVCMCHVV